MSISAFSVAGYTATNTTRLVSEEHELEPPICNDTECTYPYGPACAICYFRIVIKQDKIDYDDHLSMVYHWVDDVNVQKYVTNARGETFVAGAEERDENDSELERDVESFPTEALSGFLKSPVVPASGSETQRQVKPASIYGSSRSPSVLCSSLKSNIPHTQVKPQLSPRLKVLFANTLAGHVAGRDFVGGATDAGPINNPCPFCFQPIGDPRLQHFLRCKYAHEEKEREERMLRMY